MKNLLIVILTLTPIFLMATSGAPPKTPIDGGLSLLLAAGGAYGLKKVIKSKKK